LYASQIRRTHRVGLPALGDLVPDGRKDDLHNKLKNSPRQRTHRTLQKRPTEAAPIQGREKGEHDDRENKIIKKLSDKGRYVASCGERRAAVGIFPKQTPDEDVERAVDAGRGKERHRAGEQNEPRAAENAVKGGIIVRRRGNDAGHKKDQTGQKIDARRQNRDAVGRLRPEVLGNDVHTHERQPRNENTAVEGDPRKLQQRFVGQKIHANDADNEQGHHRSRDRPQQQPKFTQFLFHKSSSPREKPRRILFF